MTKTKISLSLTTPPLESGDSLTRAEFERRYQEMPEIKKAVRPRATCGRKGTRTKRAELIEGVVYVASPLRYRNHGLPHAQIMTWLGNYWAATPGVGMADNATVRLDADNELQPDALLRRETGGQSSISEDDYVEGGPELIVEIAASTASIDLHDKLKVYRRNQVQEYLVWRVYDSEFDWYYLIEGEYKRLDKNTDGILCSRIFPGLWLDVSALLTGNLAKVLEVEQQGLTTVEDQQFIKQLSK